VPSQPEHVNDVHLVGRLAAEAQERTLPSGDLVVGFRLVVERPPRDRRPGGPRIDALECSAFALTLRRNALRWSAGDVVEVTGRLRRRFRRSPAGPTSRWEVEVASVRRLQRAAA
jgi:single-strand DNA-binding protein